MQVESTSKLILTVDEANEDTISAFEETDAAVDDFPTCAQLTNVNFSQSHFNRKMLLGSVSL